MIVLPAIRRLISQQSHSLNSISPLRCLCSQTTGKLDPEKFDETAQHLESLIANFRQFSPRAHFFSPEIELHDEIQGKKIKGAVNYQLHAIKYIFYFNWHYNGFQIKPIQVTKNLDQSTIDIKWQFFGKPGYMFLYIADLAKLGQKGDKKDDWDAFEGLASFHLDENGKVGKQTLKLLKRGTYRDVVRLPMERSAKLI